LDLLHHAVSHCFESRTSIFDQTTNTNTTKSKHFKSDTPDRDQTVWMQYRVLR
jgi:hypothetical protein